MIKILSKLNIIILFFGVIPAIGWVAYGSFIIFMLWNNIASYWVIIYAGAIFGTTGLVMSLFDNKGNVYISWIKSFLLLIGIATMLAVYLDQKVYREPLIWEQTSMIMPILLGLIAIVRSLGWEINITIAARRR